MMASQRAQVQAEQKAGRGSSRRSSADISLQDLPPATSQVPLHMNKQSPVVEPIPKLQLRLRDVNPLSAVFAIMRVPINALAVICSGLASEQYFLYLEQGLLMF